MRLSLTTLDQLPVTVQPPGYDPSAHGVGIVHLGIGAFHRCHMAVYTDQILREHGGDWRILGVSLRSTTIRDQLVPQDGLYTIVVKDGAGAHAQVIGSVAGVLWAPEDTDSVLAVMASPKTKIISLTVTEKGYCHDPATGKLNPDHPDILHDLAHPKSPKSAIGYLVRSLERRRHEKAGPVTILCCDNLPSNGKIVQALVLDFASRADATLTEWIMANATFPSTMVDRIVPAMEAAEVKAFSDKYHIEDAAVLQTEPFTQWVIEDNFATDRPAWENAGAMLVTHVEPFEDAKLRMLNGAHSALAYLGFLSGYEYVHQAMQDEKIRSVVDHLMREEAARSLTPPEGFDLEAYSLELQERFDNPALQHRTYQIAMDGSQKIPQRFLGTIRTQLKTGGSIKACCLGIAAWMRYVMAKDEQGEAFVVQDPFAKKLTTIAQQNSSSAKQLCVSLLAIRAVFGPDLIQNARFVSEVENWLELIFNFGIEGALKTFRPQNAE